MMPKGNQKRETQQNPLPLKQVWLPKGNEKRETQQNPLLLPPARSEKGNENRGNPRNPLPLKQVWLPKGNEKKPPTKQGSRTKVRLPYSIFSQQLLLTIFFQNLLNSLGWIQQVCDG